MMKFQLLLCMQLLVTCILPYMQVVKNEYSSHAHQQFSFNFGFTNEFVSLNIPQEGLQLGEWKITPFYNPIVSSSLYMVYSQLVLTFVLRKPLVYVFVNLLQITRQQVNLFNSGKNIPKCELVLEWNQDTPPTLLHHSVDLLGAGDHNYFLLRVNPGKRLPCFQPFCPALVTCSTNVGEMKILTYNNIHSVQICDSNHTHSNAVVRGLNESPFLKREEKWPTEC